MLFESYVWFGIDEGYRLRQCPVFLAFKKSQCDNKSYWIALLHCIFAYTGEIWFLMFSLSFYYDYMLSVLKKFTPLFFAIESFGTISHCCFWNTITLLPCIGSYIIQMWTNFVSPLESLISSFLQKWPWLGSACLFSEKKRFSVSHSVAPRSSFILSFSSNKVKFCSGTLC